MTQRETIKKVLRYIRKYWFYLIISLILALVTVALTLYVPILTGQAVDLIVEKGAVIQHILLHVGAENGIHRKFINFPHRAQRKRKAKRKYGNEHR